ncbi:MAG: DUF4367 domain-containing protein [Lachnospiraceae bacterium]|nr:DUF4367 domain-containing protein [Lachnospiraceae bacterium]
MMDQKLPKEAVWDALLYAAAPYAGKKELEEYYAADPNVVMPEKARKRMNLRLRRERKYREAHETYRPVLVTVQRILVAVATLLAVTLLAFLPSEKVREAMWDTVVEWGEESILVSFVGGDMSDVPTEILEYREPRAIGDEFERTVVYKEPQKYCIIYKDQDITIEYEQRLILNTKIHVSNEETKDTLIYIDDSKGIATEYLLDGDKYINVIWSDGKYEYWINGNIQIEYIQSLANSVQ